LPEDEVLSRARVCVLMEPGAGFGTRCGGRWQGQSRW
jgi:hypothetical protein